MGFRRPRKLETEGDLYEYAVGALGRRMRSVAELKRLLRRRVDDDSEIGKTLVELVIRRLKDQAYLNDAKYAAAYSSFRRDNEKFGRRRVIIDLKVKGVHQDVIEKAIAETYSNVDETAQARAFLKRKRLNKPANNRETARIFRALVRAGRERQVPVWCAADIEALGIGELRGIAVGGADAQRHRRGGLQHDAAELHAFGGHPVAELVGAFIAQDFLDRRLDQIGVLDQPLLLCGMLR